MEKINGSIIKDTVEFKDFKNHDGEVIKISGYVHRIREMTGFSFVIIRTSKDLIQCVYAPEFSDYRWDDKITEEACVNVYGKVVSSLDAKGNERFELQIHNIEVLSLPMNGLAITLPTKYLGSIHASRAISQHL